VWLELQTDLPVPERKNQVTVLDIAGDFASAKLATTHWVDYVTLSRLMPITNVGVVLWAFKRHLPR
jgi:hypothetical protein